MRKKGGVSRGRERASKRWRIATVFLGVILLAGALAMPSAAFGWKPKTHLFTAQEAVAEILDGPDPDGVYRVTIDGRKYDVDPHIAAAISNYPAHYFGGAIGPDGFPDIVFGQATIHPDSRCENGAIEWDDECDFGPGASFSDEWLRHLYQEAWTYYVRCSRPGEPNCPDAPGAVLAFAYGFLAHAAGDLWGHTYINIMRGVSSPISWTPVPIKGSRFVTSSSRATSMRTRPKILP